MKGEGMDEPRVVELGQAIRLSGGRLFYTAAYPAGRGHRGKPEFTVYGDTEAEALRGMALWFEQGCPSIEEIKSRPQTKAAETKEPKPD